MSRDYEKAKKQLQRLKKKHGSDITKLYAKKPIPKDMNKYENTKAYFNYFEIDRAIQIIDSYFIKFKSNNNTIKVL